MIEGTKQFTSARKGNDRCIEGKMVKKGSVGSHSWCFALLYFGFVIFVVESVVDVAAA